MIAVDANVLVYAHRADSPFHAAARAAVAGLAEGRELWAVPWPCVHEFLAIVTHPRIYRPPSPLERALDQVEAWMESPTLRLIGEIETYWPTLKSSAERARVAGPQLHDARIAAICRSHQVRTLWTADRDFGRFADLHVVNPLVGKMTGDG